MAQIDFTSLEEQISRDDDVNSSAATLLRSLAQMISDAASEGTAKVQELADKLRAQSDALAAAVAENTPGAPTEPGGEEPGPSERRR